MMTADRLHMVLTRLKTTAFPLIFVLFSTITVSAEGTAPLFSNEWLIEATIEAPFDRIMRERDQEDAFEGVFSYVDPAGLRTQLAVKLRVRGNYRLRDDVCEFAPLRLNFKKKQVSGTEFDGQDKLKLVTHCDNANSTYEQFILKEYLSYRFLEELTENAFHTRLLRVTYVDSEGKSKTRTKYAFLIEHQKQLTERLDASVTKVESIKLDQLEPSQTNLVTVFSYFIGNTDFSTIRGAKGEPCCHNVALLEQETGLFLPIPYDFDLSGMVSASYATPNPKLGIKSVSNRLYRGWCQNKELLNATFSLFHNKRDNINALITNLGALSDYSRKKMGRYINRFYKTLANDARIKRKFIKACS